MAAGPGSEAGVAEAPQPQERFSVTEQSARLGTQNDAVFDGKKLLIQYLEPKKNETADQRVDKLIASMQGLKAKQDLPQFTLDKAQYVKLQEDVKALTSDKGPYTGLLVNILAEKGSEEASAVAMVVFMRKLVEADPNKSQAQVLKEAHAAVKEAYGVMLPDVKSLPKIAAVLIDKKGQLSSISCNELTITSVDKTGKVEGVYSKIDNQIVNFENDSSPKVTSRPTKDGEKIFISGSKDIPTIQANKNKNVDEVLGAISTPTASKRETSGSAGAQIEAIKAAAAKLRQEVKPLPAPRRDGTPQGKAVVAEVGSRVRIPPYYKDGSDALSYDKARQALIVAEDRLRGNELISVNVDYMEVATRLLAEAKKLAPNVTTAQVLDRLMNPGNYLTKTDAIYDLIGKYENKEKLILALEIKQADVRVLEKQRKATDTLGRLQVRTEVQLDAPSALQHSGVLESVYENGKLTPTFETDLHAFTFIADTLMDIQDPILGYRVDGKPMTYKEKFAELMKNPSSPQAQKALLEYRQHFYKQAIEALQTQNLPQTSEAVTGPRKIIQEMRDRIKILKLTLLPMTPAQKAEYVKQNYKGVIGDPSSRTDPNKPEVKGTLEKLSETFSTVHIDEIFKMSLKGADFMWRRSLLENAKSQEQFHIKKLYQGKEEEVREQLKEVGDDQVDLGDDNGTPKRKAGEDPEPAPVDGKPRKKAPGDPDPEDDGEDTPAGIKKGPGAAPIGGAPGGLDGRLGAAPIGVGEGQLNGNLGAAPIAERNLPGGGGNPVGELAGAVPVAPMGDRLRQANPDTTPGRNREGDPLHPDAAPVRPPGTPRPTDPQESHVDTQGLSATIGIASTDSKTQTILRGSEHLRSYDASALKPHGLYKIPIIGGLMFAVRHPIALIWQNNIARSVFEQRNDRYVNQIGKIIRQGGAEGIPMDVHNKLIDLVVDKGKEEKSKRSWFRKRWWNVLDTVKGVLGVGQSSERVLGLQWLEENQASVELDEKNAGFRKIVDEQTSLGERFATTGGLSLEQANATVLKYKNEKRYSAEEVLGERYAEMNDKLKQIVQEYCTTNPPPSDKEILEKIITFFGADFKNMLPPQYQKDFNEGELASNILPVVKELREKWADLNASGEGGSKWDKFKFNVLFGKAEWDPTQGRVEAGFARERLVRMLARHEAFPKVAGYASSVVNDAVTYGGAFLAGWGLSGINFVTARIPGFISKAMLGPMGMIVGAGAMTTIKETGFTIPLLSKIPKIGKLFVYHGRTQKEAAQASREVASGAQPGEQGSRRAEVEKTLVKWKQASELKGNLDALMRNENMTDADAMKLLATIADLKARFRLTDLSGDVRMDYQTQNYIRYSEGNKRKEENALRGGMLNAIVKLQQYQTAHPNFAKDKALYQSGSQYGKDADRGLVEMMSGLAEAQLRYGSDVRVAKKWLGRQQGMKKTDVEKLINDFYASQKKVSATEREDSLQTKRANLRKLTIKRGAGVIARTIITAPIMSAIYGEAYKLGAEAVDAIKDDVQQIQRVGAAQWFESEGLGQEVKDIRTEGVSEWASDWGKMITKGQPDVDVVIKPGPAVGAPAIETLQLDVTPFQKSFLLLRNQIDPPIDFAGVHNIDVNGTQIQMPGQYSYWTDDKGHSAIVDLQNISIKMDLSHIKLEGSVDAAGNSHLVGINDAGVVVSKDMLLDMQKAGISITAGKGIPEAPHETTIWEPAKVNVDQTLKIDGRDITVKVPENTKWEFDAGSQKWDLIAVGKTGAPVLSVSYTHLRRRRWGTTLPTSRSAA